MNTHQRRLFSLLIISSILMFASILSMSYRVLGLGLLQWVIVVFIAFSYVWRGRVTFGGMLDYNSEVARDAFKDNKYFKAFVYVSVMPTMSVGLIVAGLMIFTAIAFG